jgi:hypothetical protein
MQTLYGPLYRQPLLAAHMRILKWCRKGQLLFVLDLRPFAGTDASLAHETSR